VSSPETKYYIAVIILIANMISAGQAMAKQLTLLYTGDTHAALYPCDCPTAAGGITRRAKAIKEIRKTARNVLLMDSGGFVAGGIFDEHTAGDELDSARTRLYLEAMQIMGYDALALGDEELRLGSDFSTSINSVFGLKLLSANVVDKHTGNLLTSPYVIKQMDDNLKVAMIGLTTTDAEPVLPAADRDRLKIQPPIEALRQTLVKLKKEYKYDLLIVLSHLGEEKSRQLMNEVPEVNILVNGHSKDSLEMLQKVGTGLMLQFSFQGRQLGRLDLKLNESNEVIDYKFNAIRISEDIPDDEAMLDLLKRYPPKDTPAKAVLDLYVMSDCPFCKEAEAVMHQLLKMMGDTLTLKLHYIPFAGSIEDAAGQDIESQIQLLIKESFPDKFWNYLDCRNQDISGIPWERCATKEGIDVDPIKQGLANGQAEAMLRLNMARAQRLQVSSTPTLFVNHKFYRGQIEELALIKYLCQQLPSPESSPICNELPGCQSDQDCYQPGMVGSCEQLDSRLAECSYQPAVEVPLTIVQPDRALNTRTELRDWLMRLLPGINIEYVTAASPQGEKFIQEYNLERLPAYLFSPEILGVKNIDPLKEDLRFVKDRFLLSPVFTQSRFYINRPHKPGRIEFLFSPLSYQSYKVLLDVYQIIEEKHPSINFVLRYLVKQDKTGNLIFPQGLAESEEARRQVVISRDYTEKFGTYLRLRSEQLDSSYWEQPLLDLGLDPYKIKQQANSKPTEEILKRDASILQGLEITSVPTFLVNNQELIELHNKQQFKELLNQIQAHTTSDTKPATSPVPN
jgi:glutaredoxin